MATIRENLCKGLEALGYQHVKDTRTRRYQVYKAADGKLWYVGRAGALRFGRTIYEAAKAPDQTREYVLSAPVVRPLLETFLATVPLAHGVDLADLAEQAMQHDKLASMATVMVRLHLRQMLRDRGINYTWQGRQFPLPRS